MVLPVNTTGELWAFTQSSTAFTGSLFLTMLFTVVFFIALAYLFRMPIWSTALVIIPFIVVVASYSTDFKPVLGITLIFLGWMLADAFYLK